MACLLAFGFPSSAQENRYEFTEPQMGVPFRLVFYAPDQSRANSAAAGAYETIRRLNAIFSDYEADSELSLLSQTSGSGRSVPLSSDLWEILQLSQELSSRSDGAFDITVGPYVKLWRMARSQRRLPSPDRLAAAKQSVGFQKLLLDGPTRSAKLLAPGMRLDLGAIAKGFAVDRALQSLHQRGITRALVAGGGDLAASGPPPGAKGWQVEIPGLGPDSGSTNQRVLLANQALATSGDTFQRLEIDGKRYSHIVDPATGYGLTDHSLVTVLAPDCTTADSLATTVSVLGPARGLKLIEATPGTSVRILRQPGETVELAESPGFKKYYERPER